MVESKEKANWNVKFILEKRKGDINAYSSDEGRKAFLDAVHPYEVIRGEDNCLLNTGIDEMWDLITGTVSGADHIYDISHAQIGVGEDNTAANASQTDLQGSSKTYKGMDGGFPTSTAQKVTLKASFGSAEANNVWAEWVIKQLTSAICLNRKVTAMGTKASGSTWTLEITITLS